MSVLWKFFLKKRLPKLECDQEIIMSNKFLNVGLSFSGETYLRLQNLKSKFFYHDHI